MNEIPAPCVHCLGDDGALAQPLAPIGDPEGARVPPDLPPVIDAHVHLFPDSLFEALWRWFDAYGWPVRYRLYARQVIEFQLSRGVERLVALHYAHQPGMARALNRFVADLVREEPRVLGLATVYPGEADAERILDEAFALGLGGVKLHCHVQCFSPDDEAMHTIYATCAARGKPLVMHAGREPKSPAYKCDPHLICGVERVERALQDHPTLKLCIPHLGFDEVDGYLALLERYPNLWLDTTMVVADFFPVHVPNRVLEARPERILYGTDFPNLPYAWDRELGKLSARKLHDDVLERILGANARELFDLPASS